MINKKFISFIAIAGFISSGLGISIVKANNATVTSNVDVNYKKENIQNFMVNSIDHFDNAKGSLSYYAKHSDTYYEVEFEVKLGDTPSSYTKLKSKDNDIEYKFDGELLLEQDNRIKEYSLYELDKNDLQSSLKGTPAKERYEKGEDGKTLGVILRKDPSFMGLASDILFNQNIALGFLEDYTKWEIQGNEDYLGLNAVTIKGELNDYYKEKHQAEIFKLWVHQDTGILLKMEEYSKQGDIVYYIKANDIKLNSITDSKNFEIEILGDYTERKFD